MSHSKGVQVIAITSGKGGVGKSNIAVNLSLALIEQEQNVLLFDADLSLANVDVLLGVTVTKTVADVLSGRCSVDDIIVTGPNGLSVVPASCGLHKMASMGAREYIGVISAFSQLQKSLDVMVIDTAPGLSQQVVHFLKASQEIVVVICDEPSSISDAYALIKMMNVEYDVVRFRVVVNMAKSESEGEVIFNKLLRVTDRFLDVSLQYTGCIPYDETIKKSVMRQKPVFEAYPKSKAAIAFRNIAAIVKDWPLPQTPKGHIEFFVESLVENSVRR